MKKCPFCAEDIQDGAIKCKHCGEWLTEKPQNSMAPITSRKNSEVAIQNQAKTPDGSSESLAAEGQRITIGVGELNQSSSLPELVSEPELEAISTGRDTVSGNNVPVSQSLIKEMERNFAHKPTEHLRRMVAAKQGGWAPEALEAARRIIERREEPIDLNSGVAFSCDLPKHQPALAGSSIFDLTYKDIRPAECKVDQEGLLFVGAEPLDQAPLARHMPLSQIAKYHCSDLTKINLFKSDLYGIARSVLIIGSMIFVYQLVTKRDPVILVIGPVALVFLTLLLAGTQFLFNMIFGKPKKVFILFGPDAQERIRFWVDKAEGDFVIRVLESVRSAHKPQFHTSLNQRVEKP